MRHRRKLSFITMHSFTQITSRIELRGIVPSNLIKVTFIIILFNLQLGSFFFFFSVSHRKWRKMWVDYWGGGGGGGGGKGYVGPPLKLLGGPSPPPLPTPMKRLNNKKMDTKHRQTPPLFLCLWSTWTTKQWTPNIGRYRKSSCSRKF